MCLDVLGMHGEVEEVWSGGSACWLDRSLVPGDVNPHDNGLGACEAELFWGSTGLCSKVVIIAYSGILHAEAYAWTSRHHPPSAQFPASAVPLYQ